MIGRRRLLVSMAPLVVVLSSCGSGTDAGTGLGGVSGDSIGVIAERPAATPTTSVAPSTTTTARPSPSTTVAALSPIELGPDETLVATVRPEVSVIATFEEPDGEPVFFEFPLTNPTYWENELVLMVTEDRGDDRWLKVQIPVRPNGTEVWIRAADVTLSTHRFRAEVNVTTRSVKVWDGGDLVADTTAVVGKQATPTPVGRFYVNELVAKWEGSAYGPYILGLSGFSEALETFGGGLPAIAIHGTNRPELIGGAHSNGCIRIPNEVVSVLAETVPMGTPVDIVA